MTRRTKSRRPIGPPARGLKEFWNKRLSFYGTCLFASYREDCLLLLLQIAAVLVQGLRAQFIFTMYKIQNKNRNTYEKAQFTFTMSKIQNKNWNTSEKQFALLIMFFFSLHQKPSCAWVFMDTNSTPKQVKGSLSWRLFSLSCLISILLFSYLTNQNPCPGPGMNQHFLVVVQDCYK